MVIQKKTSNKNSIIYITQTALFAALICVLAPISIYIGLIPFSLGLFAVLFAGVVLDVKTSVSAVFLYLVLGLFLPVFASYKLGLSAILGPTGGFIFSYPIITLVVSYFCSLKIKKAILKTIVAFLACIIGTLICYLFGSLYFSYIGGVSFINAVSTCVLPFIIFDLIKVTVASVLGIQVRFILSKLIAK